MNNAQRIWQSLVTNDVDKVTFLPCNKLNALMQHAPVSIDVWNILKSRLVSACASGAVWLVSALR